MSFPAFEIIDSSKLNQLLKQGVFWRKKIGLIILKGAIQTHPQKSFWQNELNTHYYACGCDESAVGFFLGVILGSLWLAFSWFQGITPDFITIIIAVMVAAAGGLIGKAIGKLIANQKLKTLILILQKEL